MSINFINYSTIIIIVVLFCILIFHVIGLKKNIGSLVLLVKQPPDRLLNLKLQASERFMIFVERIDPINLTNRVHPLNKKAQEYRLELIYTIRSEYSHNIAWQLYLNDSLALRLKYVINESILSINAAMDKLQIDAKAIELSKSIVTQQLEKKNNIYFEFQSYLRKYIS